ncbi:MULTISPECIES: YciI family protein [Dietzia]|uniref:YciI family protein n=1 Tax=Dietzia sp. Die43 TaxID=2926011 RepID=UPI0021173031|nr:YciI family protein [Dietzia sp. Die43]
MAKYLMLKHYRGSAPEEPAYPPLGEWDSDDVAAHFQYMEDFADRLRDSGEYVDSHALSESGTWVRYDGEGRPPLTDGPFAETKDLIAGWMIIDVADYDRALALASELSAAPGPGGEPIREWLELRPLLTAPTEIGD